MALSAEGGGIRGDEVRARLRSRGVEPTTEGEAAMGAATPPDGADDRPAARAVQGGGRR